MSESTAAELERMRAAFAARPARGAAADCPPPDRLWDAQLGTLSGSRARAVVEHMASCPSCAEDWRLASALAPAEDGRRVRRRRHLGGLLAVASALAAVLVLALPLLRPAREESPAVYRGARPYLEAADQVCVRSDCVLTWAPGPSGAVYDLSITTVDFDLVVAERGLMTASYRVPPERLASFPAGSELYWQVKASFPDRSSAVSKTLVLTLE